MKSRALIGESRTLCIGSHDVTMNEDQTRNRLDNGPENPAILRHMTLNILTAGTAKISKRRKLKRAGWSNEYLRKILVTI